MVAQRFSFYEKKDGNEGKKIYSQPSFHTLSYARILIPNFHNKPFLIQGVDDFIYRNLIDARPGTYLDQALLRQGTEGTTYSVPRIYSTLRANLQRDIDGHYAAKANYDRRRDDLLRAAKN